MTKRLRTLLAIGAVCALALTLAACSDDSGDSAKSTTTTTEAATTTTAAATTTTAAATTTTAGSAALVGGTYLNGNTNDPHYSLVMETSNGNGIGGTLTYFFQDGTSNQVFTFSGTASGGTGNATPRAVRRSPSPTPRRRWSSRTAARS
ncbi:MAG: hypothetical protein U0W40_16460 [Acidimicrobiia bacterium]